MHSKKNLLMPVLGFIVLILISSILLCMPISNKQNITYEDALFSSISGITCTGLSTVDISEQYNYFGQVILVILMECGALGFVIIVGYLLSLKGRKLKMSNSIMIFDSVTNHNAMTTKESVLIVIKTMLGIQILGVILLAIKFVPQMGLYGLWYSLFHVVSAYANCGFDIASGNNSLIQYQNDIYVQIILSLIMICGSVGIFVLYDFKNNVFKRMKLQNKIVLMYSFWLIVISTIILKVLQPNMNLINCIFMAIAPRSTGFTIVDMNSLLNISKILLMILMFIGGAPSSTAGGVRIITIAVIIGTIISTVKGKEDTIMYWKKIPNLTVRKAFTLFILVLVCLLIATSLYTHFVGCTITEAMFENISAISNTGLSILTVSSNSVGNIIIMIMMFIGKIGPLSLLSTFLMDDERKKLIDYPEEEIIF